MKLQRKLRRGLALALPALALAACGGIPSALEDAGPAPTVDTDAIAALVLETLAADAEQATETLPIQNPALEAPAPSGGLEAELVRLYEQTNPAVVFIVVPPIGSGSGFVYSRDGHIVTNNHVVEGGRSYEVVFASGERSRAELVGADPDSDLAVLQVEALPAGVEPLPLANLDDLRVGEFVVAIGNPFGEQGSMSMGIVSGLGRSLPSQRGFNGGSTYSLPQVIQTDAPINPGNSGGPLLNLRGEVVGVNAAIASQSGTNSGVGFSIPVQAVRQIVPALIERGAYAYPYLGAGFDEAINLDEQEAFGLPQTQGAYIVNVVPEGPADQAGLIPADPTTGRGGDLIIRIDDRPIRDFSDLNSYLVFHTTVGQSIQITLLRGGEELVLPLTLGARP